MKRSISYTLMILIAFTLLAFVGSTANAEFQPPYDSPNLGKNSLSTIIAEFLPPSGSPFGEEIAEFMPPSNSPAL